MKATFSLFYKICIALAVMGGITSANAYTTTDQSYLKINLGTSWKIKKNNTQQTSTYIEYSTEYINTTDSEHIYIFKNVGHHPSPNFMHRFYDAAKNGTTTKGSWNEGCQLEDIPNISSNYGAGTWGLFKQCPPHSGETYDKLYNKSGKPHSIAMSTGFTFFIDGDPQTTYLIGYNVPNSYPITPTQRAHMIKILKSIEMCYKNKTCTPLIH